MKLYRRCAVNIKGVGEVYSPWYRFAAGARARRLGYRENLVNYLKYIENRRVSVWAWIMCWGGDDENG